MQDLKQTALTILQSGLDALKPEKVLTKEKLEKAGVLRLSEIYVIGFGKGVRFYAEVLEDILGEKIKGGMVNDIAKMPLRKIIVNQAVHPLPDRTSFAGTQKILQLLRKTPKTATILCLISGGGSALLTWPTFSVKRFGMFFDLLIKSGADIHNINIIRKHIDRAKGGGLVSFIYPRKCISLIISDVPGDDLKTIASGPTVFDATTNSDAQTILKKYQLPNKIDGSSVRLIETPKDKKLFKDVQNILIATNKTALEAMAKKAIGLGYKTKTLDASLNQDAESVGQMILEKLKVKSEKLKAEKMALIAGGETTIKVSGNGRGGRNTHLCLSALKYLPKNTILLSIDSDGQDNSDAAGAIISEETFKKAERLGLNPDEYLKNFDSYNFFSQTGDLIKTGSLPTNVGDLMVVLRG